MPKECERLTSLVNTLLRLSYGDAGTVRLSRTSVDLGQLTRDVVASLSILAEERHQQLKLDVADGVHVSADRLVLREAVTNVVDNPINYGPETSTIYIRVREDRNAPRPPVAKSGPVITAHHR